MTAERLKSLAENILGDYQCGFPHNRCANDHIFTLRQIHNDACENGLPLQNLFIAFKQANELVRRKNWLRPWPQALKLPKKRVRLIKMTLGHTHCRAVSEDRMSKTYVVNRGFRHELSLLLLERAVREGNLYSIQNIYHHRHQCVVYAENTIQKRCL